MEHNISEIQDLILKPVDTLSPMGNFKEVQEVLIPLMHCYNCLKNIACGHIVSSADKKVLKECTELLESAWDKICNFEHMLATYILAKSEIFNCLSKLRKINAKANDNTTTEISPKS